MENLKPGCELDALIAEKVMGYDVGDIYYDATMQEIMPKVPSYSTDIAAAWEIVEKLEKDGFNYLVSNGIISTALNRLGTEKIYAAFGTDRTPIECYTGQTAPHAICLAALKAVS